MQRWELTFNRLNASPGGGDRRGIPLPVASLGKDGFRGDITLARLKERFRYELRNSFGEIWQWTTDGHLTWAYRPDRNVYTQTQAEPWPERLGPGPGLPGTEWKYLTKFLAIGDMSQRATIDRDDIPADKNCAGPSVLMTLSLSDDPDLPSSENLRILTRSYLPCYSVITRREKSPHASLEDTVESIIWRFRDGAPESSEISFAPKNGARLVKRLPNH
ncbi:MAG TPA: hypothetical protein VKB79_24580 [Bryobacteraceae bacterium]|nr:hypothetical protein [Bryobacteraceae bacterium]